MCKKACTGIHWGCETLLVIPGQGVTHMFKEVSDILSKDNKNVSRHTNRHCRFTWLHKEKSVYYKHMACMYLIRCTR